VPATVHRSRIFTFKGRRDLRNLQAGRREEHPMKLIVEQRKKLLATIEGKSFYASGAYGDYTLISGTDEDSGGLYGWLIKYGKDHIVEMVVEYQGRIIATVLCFGIGEVGAYENTVSVYDRPVDWKAYETSHGFPTAEGMALRAKRAGWGFRPENR
jgi:hypothetical protein